MFLKFTKYYIFTAALFAVFLTANSYSYDINQKIRTIRKYGVFHIRVVKKINASSAIDDNLVATDAKVKVLYKNGEETISIENALTKKSLGTLRLPIMAEIDGVVFSLKGFEINSKDGKDELLEFDEDDIKKYRDRASNGILISVIYSNEGSQKPKVQIEENVYKIPSEYIPNEKFVSISKMNPSVEKVLSDNDYKKIIQSFKSVASATEKYHQELVDLVKATPRFTSKQFLAILDSVYFPLVTKNLFFSKYKDIRFDMNPSAEETTKVLGETIALADRLSPFINKIIELGLDKVTDLDPSFARLISSKAYPENTNLSLKEVRKTYQQVFSKIKSNLTQVDKYEFLQVALDRCLDAESIEVGTDWFIATTNKSLYSYEFLIDRFRFSESAANTFIVQSFGSFVDALVKSNSFAMNEINTVFRKCRNDICKSTVLVTGFKNISKPVLSDFLNLLIDIEKVSVKDTTIESTYETFKTLDQKQAFLLVKSASQDYLKMKILLKHFESFKNISLIEFNSIVSTIGSALMRDEVVLKFMPLLTEVSIKSLSNLIPLLSEEKVKFKIFDKLLAKPEGGIRASDVVSLAALFSTEEFQEKALQKLVGMAGSSATEEIIPLVKITQNEALLKKVIMAFLPIAYDLNPSNYVDILDRIVSGTIRNAIIFDTVKLFKRISANDTALIVQTTSSSEAKSKVAIILIPEVVDFTLDYAITIAKEISEPKDRDAFLVKVVGWIVPLTRSGLNKLMDLTTDQKNKSVVYIKGMKRLPVDVK